MRNILASALLLAAALSSTTANALDSSGTPVVVTPLASKTTTASGQPITMPQKNVEVQVSDSAGRDADRHERLPANGVGPRRAGITMAVLRGRSAAEMVDRGGL